MNKITFCRTLLFALLAIVSFTLCIDFDNTSIGIILILMSLCLTLGLGIWSLVRKMSNEDKNKLSKWDWFDLND